jgi:hypothetical protein
VRSGYVQYPALMGRSRHFSAWPWPGCSCPPCSLSIEQKNNLHLAGNPAVIAPRFRPVALRPRLSAGLPLSSKFNMPNKLRRDKRGGTRQMATNLSKPFRRADSVKELLDRNHPTLTRVADQSARQKFWNQWLAQHLPAELTSRLSGVVERDDTLVIFAESAAWSARLRYFMQELQPLLKQTASTIQHVSVRVRPRT